MDSDTDSDSDYDSYDPSRPNSTLKISHVGSSGVQESAASLITRGHGSQFTSQSTQSPSSSSEEEDVEERGSEQSDSNPDSPEYHSTGNPFQQYSYSAFTGPGRGAYGRSGSSSESDEDQSQEGFLSKPVDKKVLKRNKPPSSPEGSSSSSAEDGDKHVVKKTKADHDYSDFAKKMMDQSQEGFLSKPVDKKVLKRNKPPSPPEGSSSSSAEDSDKHVVKKPHIETKAKKKKTKADHDYSDFPKKMKSVDKKVLKRNKPPSPPEGSSSSSAEDSDKHVVKKTKADHDYSDFAKKMMDQSQEGFLSKPVDKKVLKRNKPPSPPEGSSSSSAEDSDKHVVKKPHIETKAKKKKTKADHDHSDFPKKMKSVDKKVLKRNKPPSPPEGSSSSSAEDSDKHVVKKTKADHDYSDFAKKMMDQSQEGFLSKPVDKKVLKRNKPPSPPEGSSSSSAEDSDKHVVKKTKADHDYSDFAKKMMTKMGHEPGTGLGRSGEGIVEPIKESMQRGRAGLGTEGVSELEPEDVEWEEEEVNCEEFPEWVVPCSLDPRAVDEVGLDTWFKIGKRKTTIENETLFCDEEVLKQILKNKTVFDSFDRKAFLDARDRSNPFELIKGIIFQNRAAMKMANMDAVFDFMFTGVRDKFRRKITDTNELLYFADICAGPGGFTEYVLYRTKWHAKGFGFTLKNPPDGSDFKLDEFHSSDCETFEPYYGCHGDGDITNTENLTSLQEHVFDATNKLGVHFVMGDGGISVEGEENIQELLTKQLVMCQFACALSILKEGGHFVCKLFDMYTPFLVGLIYLLYCCFEKICIIKPVTSRPANSERYVVCHGFRNTSRSVAEYLFDINDKLNELKDTEEDVIEVVPLRILQQEEDFMSYVTKSNDRIGEQQSTGLRKIQFFAKNRNLLERRQADIKSKCLKLWKFDDDIRKARSIPEHKAIFNEFWKKLTKSLEANEANFTPRTLTADNLPHDVYTWKWYYVCGARYMLVGAGRSKLKGWTQRGPLSFVTAINTTNVELPPQTVLDVDICDEFDSNGTKHFNIEVIDALSISGEFIGNRPFPERQALIFKLCKAVNKPGRTQLRLKKCYRFEEMEKVLSKLEDTSEGKIPNVVFCNEDGSYTLPKGVVLFKTLKNPWHLQFSKSSQKLYFYNDTTQESVYKAPSDSVATYQDQLQSRMLWLWQPVSIRAILGLTDNTSALQKGLLTKAEVTEHVAKRLHM